LINKLKILFNKVSLTTVILFLLLMVFFIIDLFSGTVNIPFKDMIDILFHKGTTNNEWVTIIYDFRLPKALTALSAGIALSVSGLQMQTVFRNPLAGPYVLGISAGASLGVAFFILGFSSFFSVINIGGLQIGGIIIAAWVGAAIVLMLIMAVSVRVRDIMTLLILGILFANIASAVVNVLQYFSHESALKSFVIWGMGSLGSVSKQQLTIMMPGIFFGLVISLLSVKKLNTFLLGEDYARSMGMNLRVARAMIFLSTAVLAGSVTAFCGPIGFIGIAVPHLARLLYKTADQKVLLIGCILLGGIIMLVSDIIAQLPGHQSNLPINSVTALLGIPIVIWIVVRNKKLTSVS